MNDEIHVVQDKSEFNMYHLPRLTTDNEN